MTRSRYIRYLMCIWAASYMIKRAGKHSAAG
nr:MAG TPA: hypothetical protein [Caudoviricetes sp.]